MIELKTLKDLETLPPMTRQRVFNRIRAEAAKIIKANKINEWYGEQTILFIKYFFNLKEDELTELPTEAKA